MPHSAMSPKKNARLICVKPVLWLFACWVIIIWAPSRQNLSSGFPCKRVWNQSQILLEESLDTILSKKWITNALISLRVCEDWSVPLLHVNPPEDRFSCAKAHMVLCVQAEQWLLTVLMWWIIWAFLPWPLCMLGYFSSICCFQNVLFQKVTLGTQYESPTVWIQIMTDLLSVMILVQTDCKVYQQMTKVAASKEKC